jgi:hypothetical protein
MKDLKFIKLPLGRQLINPDENDVEFDPKTGDFVTVEGHARKLQDLVKILITAIKSNPIIPDYGSTLSILPGTRAFSDLQQKVKDTIIQVMGFLQAVEQSSDPSERFGSIASLTVTRTGPQEIFLVLAVQLEDGFIVTAEGGLALAA